VTPTTPSAAASGPQRGLLSTQATALAQRSTQVRRANNRVRQALADGRLTITDVMGEPPVELADRTLFEILLLTRGVGRKRLYKLNMRAIEDGVNLALTLARADECTRRWVAANALRSTRLAVWERLML
jgi:hypothetical protein